MSKYLDVMTKVSNDCDYFRMPARRKLSERQTEILVEFAESNPTIALGRFPSGPMSSQAVKQAWDSVATQLNAVAEGCTKTTEQWRRVSLLLRNTTNTQ